MGGGNPFCKRGFLPPDPHPSSKNFGIEEARDRTERKEIKELMFGAEGEKNLNTPLFLFEKQFSCPQNGLTKIKNQLFALSQKRFTFVYPGEF